MLADFGIDLAVVVDFFGFLELFSPKRAYSHISQSIRSPLQFKISFFLVLFGQSFPGGPAQAPILYFVMRDASVIAHVLL